MTESDGPYGEVLCGGSPSSVLAPSVRLANLAVNAGAVAYGVSI